MTTTTIEMLSRVQALGFTLDEALQLRRIAITLDRWHELECGTGDDHGSWCITRGKKMTVGLRAGDDRTFEHDEDGKPFMEYHSHSESKPRYTRIPDRERGAQKRLEKIMAGHPELVAYEQGDPRGASLYLCRKSELNGSDIHSTYTRGVAVYA